MLKPLSLIKNPISSPNITPKTSLMLIWYQTRRKLQKYQGSKTRATKHFEREAARSYHQGFVHYSLERNPDITVAPKIYAGRSYSGSCSLWFDFLNTIIICNQPPEVFQVINHLKTTTQRHAWAHDSLEEISGTLKVKSTSNLDTLVSNRSDLAIKRKERILEQTSLVSSAQFRQPLILHQLTLVVVATS